MSMAESLQSVFEANSYRKNSNKNQRIIDTPVGYTHENLPDWILPYVQNPFWAKRWAVLLNRGYERELHYFVMQMIEKIESGEVVKPFNYINRSWSRKLHDDGRTFLETTLEYVRKELVNAPVVQMVAERLKATNEQIRAIKRIVWKWGAGATRYAVKAQEDGKDKFKYFCWLTSVRGQRIMRESMAVAS